MVAALLHDIGKGEEGDHSEVGEVVARKVATRIGFRPPDVEVIARLVRHHLTLIDAATSRDLDDPDTVELVARAVGDVPTLDLLALLTQADAEATGPAAWSPWRKQLVDALVERVRRHLDLRAAGPRTAGGAAARR